MSIIHVIFSLSRDIILLDKLNTCNIILWHLVEKYKWRGYWCKQYTSSRGKIKILNSRKNKDHLNKIFKFQVFIECEFWQIHIRTAFSSYKLYACNISRWYEVNKYQDNKILFLATMTNSFLSPQFLFVYVMARAWVIAFFFLVRYY